MTHGRPSTPYDGAALRQRRESGRWTLRQFAAICKELGHSVSDSELSKIERGLVVPHLSTRKKIDTVLALLDKQANRKRYAA